MHGRCGPGFSAPPRATGHTTVDTRHGWCGQQSCWAAPERSQVRWRKHLKEPRHVDAYACAAMATCTGSCRRASTTWRTRRLCRYDVLIRVPFVSPDIYSMRMLLPPIACAGTFDTHPKPRVLQTGGHAGAVRAAVAIALYYLFIGSDKEEFRHAVTTLRCTACNSTAWARPHARTYHVRQPVFSFKIRGAYNKIASLRPEQLAKGIVACSAGNHAQVGAIVCRAPCSSLRNHQSRLTVSREWRSLHPS